MNILRYTFLLLFGLLLGACSRNKLKVSNKPISYRMVKEADGSCTVSTVVRVKMGKGRGGMTLTSNKPTCEEAKADVDKGVDEVRRNN